MVVKTITVTEEAYEALSSSKEANESFSKAILRITHKKSLMEFAGALSEGSADKIEKAIKEGRRMRNKGHKKRIKMISEALGGHNGGS